MAGGHIGPGLHRGQGCPLVAGWGEENVEGRRRSCPEPPKPSCTTGHLAPGSCLPCTPSEAIPCKEKSLTEFANEANRVAHEHWSDPENPLWSRTGHRATSCVMERGQGQARRQHWRSKPQRQRQHRDLPAAEKRALGYGSSTGSAGSRSRQGCARRSVLERHLQCGVHHHSAVVLLLTWGGGGGAEKGERVSMAGEQGCFGGGGPACGFTGAPVSQETQAPVRQQGNGYRQDPSSPIPAALGPPAPVSNSPQHLKGDRNPPAKPSMLHWYPPSPRLQERHLRMLRKDPPAVKKAQRPVQRVMMKIGTRLASYQGFRNVWGDGENHVRNVTTCQPPP